MKSVVSSNILELFREFDPDIYDDLQKFIELENNFEKILILLKSLNDANKVQNLEGVKAQFIEINALLKNNKFDFKILAKKLYLKENIDGWFEELVDYRQAIYKKELEKYLTKEIEEEIRKLSSWFYRLPNKGLLYLKKFIQNSIKNEPLMILDVLDELTAVMEQYLFIKARKFEESSLDITSEINELNKKYVLSVKNNLTNKKRSEFASKLLLSEHDFFANDNIYYHGSRIENLKNILKHGLRKKSFLKRIETFFKTGMGEANDGLTIEGIYAFSTLGQIKHSINVLSNLSSISEKYVIIFEKYSRLTRCKYKLCTESIESLKKLSREEINIRIRVENELLAEVKQNQLSTHEIEGLTLNHFILFDIIVKNNYYIK